MYTGHTVLVAGGGVAVRAGSGVQVAVDETVRPLEVHRRRPLHVVATVEITTGPSAGRLVIRVEENVLRSITLVLTGGRRPRAIGDGQVVRLPRHAVRVVVVVEHPVRISPEVVVAAVLAEDRSTSPVRERRTRFGPPPGEPWPSAAPEPEAQVVAVGGDPAVGAAPPPPPAPTAAPPELPHASELQLAQVGASMPATVTLGEVVAVHVRFTRGEIRARPTDTHDEQVIVVQPDLPLTVSLLRRGFELAPLYPGDGPENGERRVRLPAPDEPDTVMRFGLRAAHPGPGEVQVVVRQQAAQPLATLRLTPTVVQRGAATARTTSPEGGHAGTGDAGAAEATTTIAGGVSPFLAPRSLTIDENLVDRTSSLTFELVIPGFRKSYNHVVDDKAHILTDLFQALDSTWREHKDLPDTRARSAAFHTSLQTIGAELAAAVLPPELLGDLRNRLDAAVQLTVITSGETDIPWELVHLGDAAVPDLEGLDFLGRAGLVRWVYNTRHPTELRVRPKAAYYLIPRYTDPTLALALAARERAYLAPFQPRAVRPGSRRGLARLLGTGAVDLLHFAGHGRSDDTVDPPVREMLLASYRRRPGGAGRGGGTFTLHDLRTALPEREPLAFSVPGPIVVVNACRLGQPPSTRSEGGGFAETFLRGGAAAFVGCLWSVGDEPARAFVEAFYARLCTGATVADATIQAREAARANGDLTWLAYTVYAHPDARLTGRPVPPPDRSVVRQEQRMSTTTTTASTTPTLDGARRRPTIGRNELAAIHPYVLNVPNGRLSDGPSTTPTSVEDYRTTRADVDELFRTVLPTFLQGRDQPVPLVIWAHGGLVDKAAGLGIAHLQVDWWKANGCFPVHFVWETGFAESLWDAVKDRLPFGGRAVDDLFDAIVEQAVRAIPASEPTWRAMKTTAALASEPNTGGAWYFARKLAEFVAAHPGAVTVHAIGHSAGSIFHALLLPRMLEAGLPTVESLTLLAPAIRVDEFTQRLMAPTVLDRIARLTMFTMSESFEKQDTCLGIYGKSLLYLIRAALEPEARAEILGLQECVLRNPHLTRLFDAPGSGSKGEVVWSTTIGGGSFSSSSSTTHGGFDNDPATMESVARRVLGRERLQQQWPAARAVADGVWISPQAARAYLDTHRADAVRPGGHKRALCIGIDAYPAPATLQGCAADARAWQQALQALGFETELLVDESATREHMLERIKQLIVSSTPGDVLALQYAGHGTMVPDLDNDEAIEDAGDGRLTDEAICPVDFGAGNLIIDDDLGEIWDLLPEGVSLTMFFDSCHSGGNQRATIAVPHAEADTRPRLVVLSRATENAYIARRGRQSRTTVSRDHDRGVFFAACRPDEVAWESGGQGDFTRRAVPLLRSAASGTTNKEFYNRIVSAFGVGPRQNPVLLAHGLDSCGLLTPAAPDRSPSAATNIVLHDLTTGVTATTHEPITAVVDSSRGAPRDRAIAAILRGIADLVES